MPFVDDCTLYYCFFISIVCIFFFYKYHVAKSNVLKCFQRIHVPFEIIKQTLAVIEHFPLSKGSTFVAFMFVTPPSNIISSLKGT